MDVFDLFASIKLDSSDYDRGIEKAKGSASIFGQTFAANLASDAIRRGFDFAIDGTKKIASGLAGLVKDSTTAFGTYEQMVGGVEKLYGSAAGKIQDFAKNAYKTSGQSANDYMNLATQFSASLIGSLNGDVDKAADVTDVAMRAMSDNVNVFGSNMEDVSNAFKGFSKQNYTINLMSAA